MICGSDTTMVLDVHNRIDKLENHLTQIGKEQSDASQKVKDLESQVQVLQNKMDAQIESVHKDLDSFYESTQESIRKDLKDILSENSEVLHHMQDIGEDVIDLTHHLESRVSCRMVAIGIAVATWSAFVTSSWF